MRNNMVKKLLALTLALCVGAGMAACGSNAKTDEGAQSEAPESDSQDTPEESQQEEPEEEPEDTQESSADAEEVEIQVFIAASLNTVMQDLAERYNAEHPNVKITYNADSSGTLLTQIEEGYECDIFFSAAQKQMNQLEEDGLIIEGSRHNVVNNQVVVVTLKDSGTAVTGLENLKDAKSIALAGGSVPVGKYTREALVALGLLSGTEDNSTITTQEISEALGGVEISECDNVSKVLIAVAEGACEVGTTYYSDTYGYEDQIEILEQVSYDLTGDVIYPICLVLNQEADEAQAEAAREFLEYVLSAKDVFDSYYFDTNVE